MADDRCVFLSHILYPTLKVAKLSKNRAPAI
jgi:hypothetical protein